MTKTNTPPQPLPDTSAHFIKLMAFDVDGVLTDGSLYFSAEGDTIKCFSSQDGHGLKMLREAGIQLAIITGRQSGAVTARATELGIQAVFRGISDKAHTMAVLLQELSLEWHQAGYMGDDIMDLPVLLKCGFSATVPDGHPAVRARVQYTSTRAAGHGAVREVCDHILAAQGKLADIIAGYLY